MRVRHGSQLFDGLNGADLVVGHHNADQRRVGANGRFHIFGVDIALAVRLDIAHFKADAFQHGHAVQNGMMLKCAGDQVLFSLCCQLERCALHSPVVGLAAAAGKKDLTGIGIQCLGHLCAAGVYQLLGLVAHRIVAAGIAARAVQRFIHGCQCLRAAGGSGSVIQIYQFHRRVFLSITVSRNARRAARAARLWILHKSFPTAFIGILSLSIYTIPVGIASFS